MSRYCWEGSLKIHKPAEGVLGLSIYDSEDEEDCDEVCEEESKVKEKGYKFKDVRCKINNSRIEA